MVDYLMLGPCRKFQILLTLDDEVELGFLVMDGQDHEVVADEEDEGTLVMDLHEQEF